MFVDNTKVLGNYTCTHGVGVINTDNGEQELEQDEGPGR